MANRMLAMRNQCLLKNRSVQIELKDLIKRQIELPIRSGNFWNLARGSEKAFTKNFFRCIYKSISALLHENLVSRL